MFEYQKWNRYFAQIAGGIESIGEQELKELGAKDIRQSYRGLFFKADQETVYTINYQSRLITRVLAPLLSFDCHSTRYLYKTAKKIKWETIFHKNHTFAIFSSVSNSTIKHSKYAALCLKDAIADYFRELFEERPDVEKKDPDVWINLYIQNNKAVISLDMSGGSLHRRGYRKVSGNAPMQETLAATIIRLSNWDGSLPVYDPMCGSGTLLCEMLMHYCKIPAAYLRKKFGFEYLPDFNKKIWRNVKDSSNKKIRQLPEGLISGSDISPLSVSMAKTSLSNLPCSNEVFVKVSDFRHLKILKKSTVICNPPFGIRLGTKAEAAGLYRELGIFLKQLCSGSIAYIYLGSLDQIKNIGLKTSLKIPLVNGAIRGRLCRFEIF
ncbi:MAG: THUMP domain-containing protein [Chitinispirillia bacterium]|jgi:putative N6-adenine-specific DNA methylase